MMNDDDDEDDDDDDEYDDDDDDDDRQTEFSILFIDAMPCSFGPTANPAGFCGILTCDFTSCHLSRDLAPA